LKRKSGLKVEVSPAEKRGADAGLAIVKRIKEYSSKHRRQLCCLKDLAIAKP
jgi:hypothetical protein